MGTGGFIVALQRDIDGKRKLTQALFNHLEPLLVQPDAGYSTHVSLTV